ncbi:hypothetical protein F0U61_47235 [Archangium violaceum]|uniref:hypothetical protein n=1 Tax=Archangium violaceum TaxID=83451 RepID=UPI002B301D2E|nr:hypothetical protein F0U61_47235 [Archangium violaceum]
MSLCTSAQLALRKAQADGTRLQRARIVQGIANKKKDAAERELEGSKKTHQALVDLLNSPANRHPGSSESLRAAKTKVECDEAALRKATVVVNETALAVANAEVTASKSKAKAMGAAERALQAQKAANASAREAGLAEPFPKANEVGDAWIPLE